MTIVRADTRLAAAWYGRYPLDAYAQGPMRFSRPVDAAQRTERASPFWWNMLASEACLLFRRMERTANHG